MGSRSDLCLKYDYDSKMILKKHVCSSNRMRASPKGLKLGDFQEP